MMSFAQRVAKNVISRKIIKIMKRKKPNYDLRIRQVEAVKNASAVFPQQYTELMLQRFPKYKRKYTKERASELIRMVYNLRPIGEELTLTIVKDIEKLTTELKNS